MSKRKSIKVNIEDYDRVLVTETLPFEMPIIFNNSGLFNFVKNLANHPDQNLFKVILFKKEKKRNFTIPYSYCIKKDISNYRYLSLIHPSAQIEIRNFYKKYFNTILYYCSYSPASLRAPDKVSGSLYTKNSWENVKQYRRNDILLTEQEKLSRYIPKFFSYRGGIERLYKFYDSKEFLELEKKFKSFWTLDVAQCFDSIYTHSLSWALRGKEFTKENIKKKKTFAQEFDQLMCYSNYGETNGIVIGPEVSRIFSEVLFQKIDSEIITTLKNNNNLEFSENYVIKRYVDDIFIFALNEDVASIVYNVTEDTLKKYKLHLNKEKLNKFNRPFITKKSKVIDDLELLRDKFLESFLNLEERNKITPKQIFYKDRLVQNFIKSIKTCCSQNEVDYEDVASFLISNMNERIKILVNTQVNCSDSSLIRNYHDALWVMLSVMFFLYLVSPSVSRSDYLCTSIILAIRFSKRYLRTENTALLQFIYEYIVQLLNQEKSSEAWKMSNYVALEVLNILVTSKELGKEYLLPESLILNLIKKENELNYFQIICLYYYIGNDPSGNYPAIKQKLDAAISKKLSTFESIYENSELCHLFFDLLSSPFFNNRIKKNWLHQLYKDLRLGTITLKEADYIITLCEQESWQVKWDGVDLLTQLERKGLYKTY